MDVLYKNNKCKKNIRSQHIEQGFYTLKVLHNKIIMDKTKTTKM